MIRSTAISKLIAGLYRAPHDYATPTAIFPSLSVDRLAADLRLQEKGMQRGKANEPPSDSQTLDDVEHLIIERIESEKRSAHAVYSDQIQTYAERMANLDFEGRFSAIQQAAPEAVSEFRAEAAQGRDELFRLRRQILDREQDRDHFRKTHNIQRSAHVSSLASRLIKIGLLCVLSVVEIVINGSFLAQGSEQGLLGGVLLAVVFALLNVIVSFLVGLLVIRLLNHRSKALKFIGFIGLLLYLGLVFLLNLSLAHYRDASGLLISDAGTQAMHNVISSPFALTDITSWVFLAIGISFSLIAMIDGIAFLDPYPGYEKIEKYCIDAHKDYTQKKSELIDNLKEIKDDASEAMNEAARDLSVRRSDFDSILHARTRLTTAFLDFQAQLERTAQALLSIYREANRRARSDPQPARFGEPYRMDTIPVIADTANDTARDDLRKAIAESQKLLTEQVAAIHEQFDTAVASYRQIDDLIPDKMHGADIKAA